MMHISRIVVVAAAVSGTLFAGGFWLEFGNPKASLDEKARDAVLIVRPLGCHHPERAQITGTAEGLINGQRRSLPLTLVPLSQPGMYAVKFDRPKEGAWVLSFVASDESRMTGGVAPIGPQGFERGAAKFMPHRPSGAEVEAALMASR